MYVRGFLLVTLFACSTAAAAVRWADVTKQPAAWHATAEARAIADNVLLYQDATGGWPKNRNMALAPAAEAAARRNGVPEDETLPTIDNGATHTQLRFLARLITAGRGTPVDRAAFDRGLDYLFTAQYPNGGWPQFYPLRHGYYTHITFNDDAMVGVLEVLQGVAEGRAPFAFTSPRQPARPPAAATPRGGRRPVAARPGDSRRPPRRPARGGMQQPVQRPYVPRRASPRPRSRSRRLRSPARS